MWDCRLLRMTPSGEWMHNECMLANGYKKANVWRWCLRRKKVGDKSRWTQSPVPGPRHTINVSLGTTHLMWDCRLLRMTPSGEWMHNECMLANGYKKANVWRWCLRRKKVGDKSRWTQSPVPGPRHTNNVLELVSKLVVHSSIKVGLDAYALPSFQSVKSIFCEYHLGTDP